MLPEAAIAALAARLRTAYELRAPIPPLSGSAPGLDVAGAYAIQLVNVRDRVAAGAAVRGHKVGLTSRAMQEMLGVHEPDYGHILDEMLIPDGSTVSIRRFLQPRVEVEIAFLLERALPGPGVTAADVLAATAAVAPAIEVIDSRIADWKITLVDTIADNASSAGVVVGPWVAIDRTPPLPAVAAALVRSGEVVARGDGAAVLGDPAAAVAWLANALVRLGSRLEPGHVVMPGSCTKAVEVRAGDVVEARFEGLGSASVAFAT